MKNKRTKLSILLILLIGAFVVMSRADTRTYTEEIRSVSIESNNYNEPGSWKIDKSAKWIGKGKAEVVFDVSSIMKADGKYKDVILVMDVSGSMEGEKLTIAKEDAHELIDTLLSDSNNRAALVTFSTTSEIKSRITNNKQELLNLIDNLSAGGNTNYNSGLKNALEVLNGYQKESNRDIVLLFMTDGYPNEDTPNQIGTYEILKDKYPYMQVSGVQYEMGKDVIEQIKEVSDIQFIADQTNLSNVLFEASVSPYIYEKFEVVDYIEDDYFYVESVNDIKVPYGEVQLLPDGNGQKVIWTLDNKYRTGSNVQMKIKLTLKDGIEGEGDKYLPTNKGEDITSKLPEEEQKEVESELTPVLKLGKYKVIYDNNEPSGCNITTNIPEEEYYEFTNVTKSDTQLSCEEYQFKGWEIDPEDDQDIKHINDEVFIMPAHDVTIRGIWTKQSISKSMDGTVYENKTLYKYVQKDILNNNKGGTYTGEHQDSLDGSGTENIYYYTNTGSNNVIFAGYCWNIIRTTDTGGVKIVYNGVPVDGTCPANRGNDATIGNSAFNSSYKSPAYVGYMYNPDTLIEYKANSAATSGSLFGTNVTYQNGTYTLTNTSTTLDENHHYTCNNTTGTCSTVRYYYYNNYYTEISDGRTIEQAINDMLYADNVNKENSGIKTTIDTWYQANMTNYTQYLEDTVWCNDRSMSNADTNGWNPNGGSLSTALYFKDNTLNNVLKCNNETDQFTTTNNKAKLDYPVGLLTQPERNLGGSAVFKTGSTYWPASPSTFIYSYASVRLVTASGGASYYRVNYSLGARPAVSLAADTNITSGDGSVETPYIIDTE